MFELYADGSFIHNPRRGGWGWVRSDGEWAQGFNEQGRSHQMELQGVVEGLDSIPNESIVVAFTDCLYVFLGAKRRKDTSVLWRRFMAHQERLYLTVAKINHHPLHTRSHHLAREAAINGVTRASCTNANLRICGLVD